MMNPKSMLKTSSWLLVWLCCFMTSIIYAQDSTKTWKYLNKQGEIAYQKGNYEEAIELFERVKAQIEKEYGKLNEHYAEMCGSLAILYDYHLRVPKKALPLYLEAKHIYQNIFGKKHQRYIVMCNSLASIYASQGSYQKAETLYLEVKNINEAMAGKKNSSYAISCAYLGRLYKAQGFLKKAEAFYLEAISIIDESHSQYGNVCIDLVDLYRKKGNNNRAEIIIRKVMHLYKRKSGKRSLSYAHACQQLAKIYEDKGDYKKAKQLFVIIEGIQKEKLGKKHYDYAITCNNLASVYRKLGDYEQAVQLLLIAKNIGKHNLGINHPDYAVYIDNLALVYYEMGGYEKAESLFLESKKLREKILGKKHPDYAISCNNLATLYQDQNYYKKAEYLYIEAKKIREQIYGKKHKKYALSCINLGTLYHNQGLYKKAEIWYKEAKKIRAMLQGKNHPDYAISCNNLASLYEDQGRYKDAKLLLMVARKILEKKKGKNNTDYTTTCNNLANIYLSQKAYKKAEALYFEIGDIERKIVGNNHPTYAYYYSNLAKLYQQQGFYQKAEVFYKKANNLRFSVLGANHIDYIKSLSNLGRLYQSTGFYQKAKFFLIKTINKLQPQIRRNLSLSSEQGRVHFFKRNLNQHFEIYNSNVKSYPVPSNISQLYKNRLLTKSLLFNSIQKTKERILNSGDTALIHQYERFIAKRVQYNKMLNLTVEKRKKLDVDLEKLAEEIDQLEKDLARKSRDFAQDLEEYQPHTWQEIQQTLKPGEAAIELIRFRWYNKRWTDTVFYAALIVTPESKYPEPVFLTNGNELESSAYAYYRKANVVNQAKDAQSYQRFWQPIQQRLQKVYPQATKLFVSLDGVYHKINLETLWNNKTKQYLGETLDIQLVSNTKDLLECTTNPGQLSGQAQRAYLFGHPDYKQFNPQPLSAGNTQAPERYGSSLSSREKRSLAGGFDGKKIPTLSKTKEEVQNVQKILANTMPSTTYLGKTATEENLKAVRNPAILHLATHGFFWDTNDLDRLKKSNQARLGGTELKQYYENPLMRTGLVWTGAQATFQELPKPKGVQEDGVLTAQEVLNMTLDSTDLVVLSACETGKGEIRNGEGVYGLQRAFLSAGAKYVLMSLWQVDDEATQWFMRYFYQDLVKHQNIHQAYRTAQQRLRKNYPAPYYWGAFVLVSR